jgi:hypothetical protein
MAKYKLATKPYKSHSFKYYMSEACDGATGTSQTSHAIGFDVPPASTSIMNFSRFQNFESISTSPK